MKTLFNTKKDVKEQAKRFELKGRSKIETTEQLLKAMKDQGFDAERKILMSVNRRLKNLHDRTQKEINNLPNYPEFPLKGAGHVRSDFFNNELLDSFNIRYSIEKNHISEISSRRQKGYFSWNKIISPELDSILINFSRESNKIAAEFLRLKTTSDIEKDKKLAENVEQKKQAEKERNEKFKNLHGEQILIEFFKHESHPAPEIVLEMKHISGRSWNTLRDLYK